MRAYPDTTFLFSFYLKQQHSSRAAAYAATMREPLSLTSLLQYEFRQALRFQAFRNIQNPREGVTRRDAEMASKLMESDLANGIAVLVPCNITEVLRRAEHLSTRHTIRGGHRSFDILHVATALTLRAREFLTFDTNQQKLAAAEGLKTMP